MRTRLLSTCAIAAFALIGAPIAAAADPGPAPPPREYRVLADLHTDAVSTFLDLGTLTLATKADVPEGNGTRFAADTVWFHVDQDSLATLPAGYEFIAPAGTQVHIAPESNPGGTQLWPGFSTESIPAGEIDDDQTTLTLVSVDGPGDLELFAGGGLGTTNRLWSSDEAFKSFRVGRTHMHANWAFTDPGTYHVTVRADATRAGQPLTATTTYTFVVGALPQRATTSTSLLVDGPSTVGVGDTVELHAHVTPATADGYIEFRDGTTVLGHEEVEDGEAELETTSLGIGTHSVTAHFVPKISNHATGSTSDPVTVTVTDDSGVPFSVTGIQPSYQPGDTLDAVVVGATPDPEAAPFGQMYRWLRRPVGATATGTNVQTSSSSTFSQVATASDDGYELSVTLRNCTNSNCSSGSVVAQTPWVTINVEQDGVRPQIERTLGNGRVIAGDTVRLQASGLNLGEGESFQFVQRTTAGTWSATGSGITNYFSFSYPEPHVLEAVKVTRATQAFRDFAVRVVRDGVAVRQSPPITLDASNPEVMIEGVQGLYMEGATADLGAVVYPAREGDDLTYQWQFSKVSNFSAATVWSEADSLPLAVQQALNVADHNEGYLRVRIIRPGWTDSLWNDSVVFDGPAVRLYVTDDPNAQLFFFSNLSAHYHQGDNVNFNLTVTPDLQEGDAIAWEWKWPDADWTPFPGPSGKSHTLKAEQALDGVQVRATLDFASDRESIVTDAVTIYVDDHGSAARQQPTIAGETSVTEGETVSLTRELPSNGSTVLTEHRWERLAAGSEEWTVIEGEIGAGLSFPSSLADDGAQYRVSLIKPDGRPGYGPSPAVTLSVDPGDPSAVTVEQPIGGTVPALLGIELGSVPSLGTFLPGRAQTYTAATTATITTTLRDARLTVADPSTTATGHLVNGDSALATPLRIAADGAAFAPLTAPLTLRTFPRAVAGEPVPLAFEQAIGAREALEVGTYAKTLTFTLSTTTP